MTQEEIRAQVDAAYDAAMREAAGWRRAYEQHARRMIFVIRLCAGSVAAIVVALLVWLAGA